jgi:hypothetical protein
MRNLIRSVALVAALFVAASTAVASDIVTLGTTKGSANAQTGAALARTMAAADIQLIPLPHRGTQIYLEKVNQGDIQFGISNPSTLNWGYRGIRTSKKAHKNLRFVANLHFFKTGLVVRNDSDIKSYDDLRGKKIPAGFRGAPGFHWNLQHKLLNANPPLTWDDVRPVPVTSLPGNWKAFKNGDVDVTIIAVGAGHAKKLHAGIIGGIRMLSINGGPAQARLLDGWPGFKVIELKPHKKTPSIRQNTRVLTFPYMLWTNASVPESVVKAVVLALYKHADIYKRSSKMVSGFDRSMMAAFTADVPMHPGALEAYKELLF